MKVIGYRYVNDCDSRDWYVSRKYNTSCGLGLGTLYLRDTNHNRYCTIRCVVG